MTHDTREAADHAAATTNLIESGQAVREEGARLLAQDRVALDARCEDSRRVACGRGQESAPQCEHFGVCEWSDSEGGEHD